MDRKEIKARAKEFAFSNKWDIWKPFLMYSLIVFVITLVISLVLTFTGIEPTKLEKILDALTTLVTFGLLPMSIGSIAYVMKLLKGEEMTVKEALTSKYSMFGLILVVSILISLFTALWSLLFVIPGIIYSYKMIMATYILAEDDADLMSSKEIMKRSEELMDGYKMDYFVFELSFLGWMLLSCLTLGIALIWAFPYMTTATIMYYEELKKVAK